MDINPITEGRTGTLETYLPEVETYLQEKAQQEQTNNQLVTQGRENALEQQPEKEKMIEEKTLSELEKEPVVEPVSYTHLIMRLTQPYNMIQN